MLHEEGRFAIPLATTPSLKLCGRGGTGRRAALRSLWEQSRGSSSLLDRTINCSFLMGLSLAAPQNKGKGDLFVDE